MGTPYPLPHYGHLNAVRKGELSVVSPGFRRVIALTMLMGPVAACGHAQAPVIAADAERVAQARQLVDCLAAGQFADVLKAFDPALLGAVSEQVLKQAWEGVEAQAGRCKRQVSARSESAAGRRAVVVVCEFEHALTGIKFMYNPAGKLVGFTLVPAEDYRPPSYARPDAYTETPVTVGSGEWALPGTLTVPVGDGPFPAVVLVHGSGPQDRDESYGPNKPFRDLALGLASCGVAVLRYEKRTLQYGPKIAQLEAQITTKEETVEDAVAAVDLLRQTPRLDPGRVFVLGHSLGGMLIPRIAQAAPQAAGLIVMAGTTRRFEDVVLQQVEYLTSLEPSITAEDRTAIEKLRVQVQRVKDPGLSPATPRADLPLGVPGGYWLDLRGYEPPKLARELGRPMLILQGERDYQVNMDDYKGWQDALADRPSVTFRRYPDLNHQMIAGKGQPTPGEYMIPGHVAPAVVEDIAAWVKAH